MRHSGVTDRVTGYGPNDHLCLPYRSRPERDAAALAWLRDGVGQGQRVLFAAADGPGPALRAELDRWAGSAACAAVRRIDAIDAIDDRTSLIDAERQLEMYAREVDEALAEGFTGVRAFCDITPRIADPARRESHACWERQADAWMAEGNPLGALCAYDATAIAPAPDVVVALHPLRHGREEHQPTFGLHGRHDRCVLEGEVDAFGAPTLAGALEALRHPTVVDLARLDFIDARGTATIAHALRAHGPDRLRLENPSQRFRQLWTLCGFDEGLLPGRT